MNDAKQPGLFDARQPRQLECPGSELPMKLADLKRRGAIVLSMTMRGNARWILSLDWPNQPKPHF